MMGRMTGRMDGKYDRTGRHLKYYIYRYIHTWFSSDQFFYFESIHSASVNAGANEVRGLPYASSLGV
jgi:hypothetical protein